MFAASVWITSDSFDSAPRITAATMQATCWSGEAVIVRSGARRILPSRILTSAISAANQISGSQTGAIGADTGRHRATSVDDQSGKLALQATPGDVQRLPGSGVKEQVHLPGLPSAWYGQTMPSWTSTADHLLHSVLVCGSGETPCSNGHTTNRRPAGGPTQPPAGGGRCGSPAFVSTERFEATTGAPVNQPDPRQG